MNMPWDNFVQLFQDHNAAHHFVNYRKLSVRKRKSDSYNSHVSCSTDSDFADQQQFLQQLDDDENTEDQLLPPPLKPYCKVGSTTTNFVRNVGDDHSYHDCT